MMKEYKPLKDPILKKWILWEVHPNYMVDVYHAKTKKECEKHKEELLNGDNNKQHNSSKRTNTKNKGVLS